MEPPEQAVAASGARVDWRKVITMRECYTLILTRFFTDPVIYFVISWFPEYLRKERGFDLTMVGEYAGLPFVAGGVGYISAGGFRGVSCAPDGPCRGRASS